ncbi:MAG: hypothetical protein M3044_00065 [Thermoproteota archaeon]|nr:hypothetical protein [Thermoproteota archaeon]
MHKRFQGWGSLQPGLQIHSMRSCLRLELSNYAEFRKRKNVLRNARRTKKRALGLASYDYEYSRREDVKKKRNAQYRKWRSNSIKPKTEHHKKYRARPEVRARKREYERRWRARRKD